MTDDEEWRAVEGFDGAYEVSSHGRIRSLDRTVSHMDHTLSLKGQIIKPYINRGYPQVSIREGGVSKQRKLHVLVARAFIPNPHGYPMVRHKDDDGLNNHVSNLMWGTHWDNVADRNGYDDQHGRESLCGRGHELTSDNTTPCSRGVACLSCKRGSNLYGNRLKAGKNVPVSRSYACNLYHVALVSGHDFSDQRYNYDLIEEKYGHLITEAGEKID